MTRNAHNPRKPLTAFAVLLSVALALVPVALAGKGSGGGKPGGGGGTTTCTLNAPTVQPDNNWAWGQSGSWGTPGQKQLYSIQIINNDVGCASSTFTLHVSAPSGFVLSTSSASVSVSVGRNAYITFYVTSPANAADGDYGLSLSLARSNGPGATTTTYYKVYSSDTTAPSVYWPNPGNGNVLSGRTYNFTASSSDDHAVKSMELYIDGAFVASTSCTDVTYSCQIYTSHSVSSGSHTATFKAYDWFGNVGSLTVSYTVS